MSKNNTLCIAEWQSFGIEDIYHALKSCHLKQNEVVQANSTICHTEGEARSISTKDNRDISLSLNMTENASANVQSHLDISVSTKPQYDDRDSSVALLPQNDKNAELLNKAQRIFSELQNFANQKGNFDDREGNHIFLTPYRNNRLKARNFVGLIQTKSGFCLEILPKTFRTDNENSGFENNQEKIDKAKQILLDMLKTLRDSPFKQSHISNLKTHRFPLLEVFANMFLDEVERLIKRGIKSDYVVREENRTFLKGKLLFGENIKRNFAHKERFFSASDEFIADIAPNRLIARTILFLSTQGFSPRTSGRINQARFIFADISPSKSIDKDFALCPNSRHYKDYELLLAWCEIFLRRKSFMPYQGGDKAFALLFDMNKLFESFVAHHLKKYIVNKKCEYEIKSQDKSRHLLEIDKGRNKFQIRPDIVCRNIKDNKRTLFIADTKWKILDSSESNNYGISQGDLYQMFAYLAKYECENGFLIYPQIDGIGTRETGDTKASQENFTYKPKSNLPNQNPHKLQILLFNLHNPSDFARQFFAQMQEKSMPSAIMCQNHLKG